MDWKEKYEELRRVLDSDGGVGIYPLSHLTKEQREAFKGTDAYRCGWNDAVMANEAKVCQFLRLSENPDDNRTMLLASDWCFTNEDGSLSINMNDIWGWAVSWCAEVPADQVSEVARLFREYGEGGLMYWHSCQENNMRSEFADNNRKIDFVRHEERIKNEVKDYNKRAYHKESYVLGANEPSVK